MNTARRDEDWLRANRPQELRRPCKNKGKTYDNVNQPSHYTEGRSFEVIDVLEDWAGRAPDPVLGFVQGQCLKYLGRLWDKKDPLEDAKKARWYLERLIFHLEGEDQVDVDDQEEIEFRALGEIPSSVLPGPDWVPFDGSDELDLWDPSMGPTEPEEPVFAGNYQGPLYAPHPAIKKDLNQFDDHEIVQTHFVKGSILGTQKNGDVRCLGTYDEDGSYLYDQIKKADPLDLAPSEFEP